MVPFNTTLATPAATPTAQKGGQIVQDEAGGRR